VRRAAARLQIGPVTTHDIDELVGENIYIDRNVQG